MEKKTHYPLLNKLRGIKNVVLGNHDRRQDVPELLKYVNSVAGFINYKGYALTHCPIHPMEIGRFRKNYHGHCVDEDTEILTKTGWKKYSEIVLNEEIYSVNPSSLNLETDYINNIIINEKYDGIIYDFLGKGLYMTLSEKHRVVYSKGCVDYIAKPINELENEGAVTIYKSFISNRKGISLTDQLLKLYIYLVADGNITPSNLCRFILKKERKIEAVRRVLTSLKIDYTENSSKGYTRINFRKPKELEAWNIKGLDSKLLDCTRHQVSIIKESYSETDGNRDLIFTSKKREVDLLQHLFIINGFQCKVHQRIHGFGKNLSYQLSVTDRQKQVISNFSKYLVKKEVKDKLMWCVETRNKNFIARKNGSVFLTGNCHEKTVKRFFGLIPDNRYVNVCCEQINYTPLKLSE